MPLLLRKIRKPRWYRTQELSWLSQGEIPADPLADLSTTSNELSTWHIEDDLSNLERVIVAIAGTWDRIDSFDYALFDQRLVEELNIEMQQTMGDTPDAQANHWHRDLVHLSAQRLAELARAIWMDGRTDRKLQKEIRDALARAVSRREIDPNRLKPNVQSQVKA